MLSFRISISYADVTLEVVYILLTMEETNSREEEEENQPLICVSVAVKNIDIFGEWEWDSIGMVVLQACAILNFSPFSLQHLTALHIKHIFSYVWHLFVLLQALVYLNLFLPNRFSLPTRSIRQLG